ncbi:type II toxin-antitoxin system RelE/ParE family toxin [Caulobacter soli]|uniref:type II toxin-antitoxin system RelE/ParE family toxin n=1 Tax=Caulobacter soli TaxID=2708539 RepID=UPI0013ED8B2B|nr:type II toxin-antitoxin system RelE/ParE family toxin [Caulobacter soli]
MRIIVAPRALDDIERLVQWLLDVDAEQAAARAKHTIEAAIDSLEEFPERGASRGRGMRELFAPFGNGAYVLRYRVGPNSVLIARIRHSRELG